MFSSVFQSSKVAFLWRAAFLSGAALYREQHTKKCWLSFRFSWITISISEVGDTIFSPLRLFPESVFTLLQTVPFSICPHHLLQCFSSVFKLRVQNLQFTLNQTELSLGLVVFLSGLQPEIECCQSQLVVLFSRLCFEVRIVKS